MKVKTNFKQMVLVDHLLYNKLNTTSKPDIHVHQAKTPIINHYPPNPTHPPTFAPPPSNSGPPPSNTAPPPPPPNSDSPISKPSPITNPRATAAPNNEWERQAHQWIDNFHQPNYVDYNDMDKPVQIEENAMHPNTAQSEPLEYTNTPQRAFMPKINSQLNLNQPTATALPQKSLEQQPEIPETPSIANEIKKAVEQEKKLHIEYAPPLPLIYSKPNLMHINPNNVQQRDRFEITHQPDRVHMIQGMPHTTAPIDSITYQPQREQQMEVDYNTPRSITHTTAPIGSITHQPQREQQMEVGYNTPQSITHTTAPIGSITHQPQREQQMEVGYNTPQSITHTTAPIANPAPAPAAFPSLLARPSLPAPPAFPSLTHTPTSMRDSSNNEDCDECENTVEYEKKLPITYRTNDSRETIPYNAYISIGARPKGNMKKVFYTCTRCNTNFMKQSSLENHNNRFHAAFNQTEKGMKRKSKEEVLPYGVPLLKQSKQGAVKRKYKQDSSFNKEIAKYKPYALEKST
jgi:uncharacterized C2H2 Zn-finger protein